MGRGFVGCVPRYKPNPSGVSRPAIAGSRLPQTERGGWRFPETGEMLEVWARAPGGAIDLPPVLVAGTGTTSLCGGKEGQGSGAEVGFEGSPRTENSEVKGSERRKR